ncbi:MULTISPECIES: GntR family transcriptional regulator [unclassified Exiguobacterium]|uniref:GntR family transcriptional regulator n=1 Tax=unclassified Exiguobacterium TaxID=2644629 RepID=UPI0008D061CC|nr:MULTISPECIES: GntR family transcriptional regulator [unclassified Exiguobacterium]OGX79596.1 GntR family transcriptional regulator [Exiguobacterium sp. SH31]TCI36266.1 GntR family transcriptional regulator [Exiguobacterium sp. SH4S7]TCI57507.1 GntR family transcriptional regulator [Exiguobacterium sp. SH1S21]TCI63222.1 GntR family transcriptional regulator [Exiguobacterium sp. SH0S2]TCI71082.1 GntR family transcriptional regulator [Exiguobacterium sp. SH0S7]
MAQRTKYNMVKDHILEWIKDGTVRPGEKIPSENELVQSFGVSRHTIRQAVGELVNEGYLYREQGSGTYCSLVLPTSTPQTIERSGNGKNIGVITTYMSDYIFPSIIRGIESHLASKGYTLTLSCTDNNVEKEKQCLEMMLDRQIDGLIVEPTKSSSYNPNIKYYLELEQQHTPYLMINQYYSQLTPPYLIMDDEKGGFLAAEHLIKLGHERIMGLFKTDDLQGVHRMRGFIRAFREYNLPLEPELIITYTTEELVPSFYDVIHQVFQNADERPSAIVCYNDQLALNVLDQLRSLRLSVPQDVSLVGYDDSVLAVATEVKLTSIVHPKQELGRAAAEWIIAAVEKTETPPSHTYEPELIVRNSTAPYNRLESKLG